MGGDSSPLRPWNERRWGDRQAQWSVNIPDRNGLEKVVKMLADRAVGLSLYTSIFINLRTMACR